MHSETTGAIKKLAVPLKLQAVNSTGVCQVWSREIKLAWQGRLTKYFIS